MKVRFRLFGTFRQRFPEYQHSQGMEVEISEEATVKDLLTLLDLSETRGAVVLAEGRVLKADDRLQPGVPVDVMQAMGGG
jgi:sulfur carrier protein ThiS